MISDLTIGIKSNTVNLMIYVFRYYWQVCPSLKFSGTKKSGDVRITINLYNYQTDL